MVRFLLQADTPGAAGLASLRALILITDTAWSVPENVAFSTLAVSHSVVNRQFTTDSEERHEFSVHRLCVKIRLGIREKRRRESSFSCFSASLDNP